MDLLSGIAVWGEVGGCSYFSLCQQTRFDRICNFCSDCRRFESPHHQGKDNNSVLEDYFNDGSLGSSVADSGVFSNKWGGGQRWHGVGSQNISKK